MAGSIADRSREALLEGAQTIMSVRRKHAAPGRHPRETLTPLAASADQRSDWPRPTRYRIELRQLHGLQAVICARRLAPSASASRENVPPTCPRSRFAQRQHVDHQRGRGEQEPLDRIGQVVVGHVRADRARRWPRARQAADRRSGADPARRMPRTSPPGHSGARSSRDQPSTTSAGGAVRDARRWRMRQSRLRRRRCARPSTARRAPAGIAACCGGTERPAGLPGSRGQRHSRRHRLRRCIARQQRLLLVQPVELPEAQPRSSRHGRTARAASAARHAPRIIARRPARPRCAGIRRQAAPPCRAQPPDHRRGGQRHPQQHVDPERRMHGQLEPQRQTDHQRADDQRQERRRPVADVERRKVEPAAAAARSRIAPAQPGEQRARRSAGTDRKGQPRRSPAALPVFRFVGSAISASGWPQLPQT